MREYTTAAKRAEARDDDDELLEPIEFMFDDRKLTAYPPKQSQMMMMMATLGARKSTTSAQVAGMIDFTLGLFDEDDRDYLSGRLMDRDDLLEWDDLEKVLEDLMEDWFNRPTEPSSASKPSPRTGGSKSTARPRSRAKT